MTTDNQVLADLYRSEGPRLQRYLAARLGSAASAGDIVHGIFLRIIERGISWRGDPAAYLSRAARNAAIDHLRSEGRHRDLLGRIMPEQMSAQVPGAEEVIVAREALARLEQALAALPDRRRHVFLLSRVHGRSYAEIARAMGISERMVAKHMARAVMACQQALEP